MMECKTITEWICSKCGYVTTIKPYDLSCCPACSGKVIYKDNTKEPISSVSTAIVNYLKES